MEPASKRSSVSTANTGVVLSTDVLWEILLRLPAKPLCRFRAACRSWRALLSDPSFIKAHAVLRPGLILALAGENDRIDMSDLSGNIVRRISIAPQDAGVPDAHPGPFYLFLDDNCVRVLDPDTGAVSTLPMDHLQDRVGSSYEALYALGRAASTGQRKVLRVLTCPQNTRVEQHCDVFTLGGDDGRRCWRPVASAPLCVKFHFPYRVAVHSAVIQGVVYLLPDMKYPTFDIFAPDGVAAAMDTNRVMAFDLEAEEWRPATLPGPPYLNDDTVDHRSATKLAKLNGRLAMLRHPRYFHDYPAVKIDLWFATDLEKGVWVKENSIRLELPSSRPCPWVSALDVHLSMVLDDGRVVFHYSGNGASGNWSWPEPDWTTRIYDPRTKSCTDVPH